MDVIDILPWLVDDYEGEASVGGWRIHIPSARREPKQLSTRSCLGFGSVKVNEQV